MADHKPAVLLFALESEASDTAQDTLRGERLRVMRSHQPGEALEQLMDEPVGLLLLEGPAMTPFAERLFRQWQERDPLLEAVGIAGSSTHTEPGLIRMDCRHIVKPPLDPRQLVDAVQDALERRATRAGFVRGDEKIASLVLQSTQALVSAVEEKDVYTRGRADRVALFAGILADEMGLDTDRVRTAARIMDVGKSGVPQDVLNKTDRLSDEEFELVKRHPVISWEMLRHLFQDDTILDVVRHHHERWDGRGYPDGLRGEETSLEARVVAVADSLDAITSTRAFRQARLWSEAVDEVVEGAGTRYDPRVVEVLEQAEERMLTGA